MSNLSAKDKSFFLKLYETASASEITTQAGEIRAKYELDLEDALISATALAEDKMIATDSKKHFAKVPDLIIVE